MKNKNQFIVRAAAILSVVLLLAACASDSPLAPTTARVKFFLGVSDAPTAGVDVLVDGAPINLKSTILPDTLKYGGTFQTSTDSSYLSYGDGTRNVKINNVGTANTLFSTDLALTAGKSYTVFFADTLAKISAITVEDVIPAPQTGKTLFRFAHLSPDYGAIDIARINNTTKDTAIIFSNIAYKTVTPFIQVGSSVAADKVDYAIRPTGKTTAPRSWTAAVFAVGRANTLVVRGFVGKTGTQAINATVLLNAR